MVLATDIVGDIYVAILVLGVVLALIFMTLVSTGRINTGWRN